MELMGFMENDDGTDEKQGSRATRDREQPRERYLSDDELSRFGSALDAIEAEDPRTRSSTAVSGSRRTSTTRS